MQVTLKSDDDANLAIDSIVAIPVNNWDLDLVTPTAQCIKKKGVCIPFNFPDVPDQSTIVPFVKVDEDAAQELPAGIDNPNEKLLYVSGDTDIVDITGPVHVSRSALITQLIDLISCGFSQQVNEKLSFYT